MLALLWEMEIRKIKEKLTFANMIREAAILVKSEKIPSAAMDEYVNTIAPFVKEAADEERKRLMEILEQEAQRPLKVRPVRMPTRRVHTGRPKK